MDSTAIHRTGSASDDYARKQVNALTNHTVETIAQNNITASIFSDDDGTVLVKQN